MARKVKLYEKMSKNMLSEGIVIVNVIFLLLLLVVAVLSELTSIL